ncbi:MAG: hypothetical protein UX10_C0018G0009 [Candidatus Magasanikbacteria bacterium GW2011_GWA2_45_39]|uniref:Coenzyme F420:L-glutamate ligase-like domain-containing protein n=1 Tax=Candidatus Magasanikbacteria bacterium GW2011_GWA2_45_39 TaxID=1619041 RepID=A0A0G1PNE7_9BACT|nr:MAG: hypothetical protein UX10_C0018G0009 [Candidatus Magasanikbacteria bacterium GW2011_GWA2_45_39]
MIMNEPTPNKDKQLKIVVDGFCVARFPIRTKIITQSDILEDIITQYAKPHLKAGDILCVSERIVAIIQGRAWPIDQIKPSFVARFLVRFVHKSPYGIGLASPWTMELAVREAGVARLLFAALCSALTKPFGVRGVFYKVIGKNINAIDGPCDYTLPPFNRYAKLGPRDPDGVARALKGITGVSVAIIDANDLGVAVLGRSDDLLNVSWIQNVFKDNPLGQSKEQTPMAIVRKC